MASAANARFDARSYAMASMPGHGGAILRAWANPLLSEAEAGRHVAALIQHPDFAALEWQIRKWVVQIIMETGGPRW